jgi:hypothetical protein
LSARRQVNTWSSPTLFRANDVEGLRIAIPTHVGNLRRIKAAEPAEERAEGTPRADVH